MGDENRRLYVGREGLAEALLGIVFLASLIAGIYAWSMSEAYHFSKEQIASYKEIIPVVSDIETCIKEGHISDKKGQKIISIAIFFYILLICMMPLFFSVLLFLRK